MSDLERIARVFPRKTNMSPADDLAFFGYQQIASDLFTDSKSDRSLTYTKHDIARRIKSVIDWKRWQILFPLLRDYWNK